MEISNRDYMEGWTDLAREVQQVLHKSIRGHNEAKTAPDILDVLNDMIVFTHKLNLVMEMYREYRKDEADKSEIEGRILYLAVNNDEKED